MMREDPSSRPVGAAFKPPQAAEVKSLGSQQRGIDESVGLGYHARTIDGANLHDREYETDSRCEPPVDRAFPGVQPVRAATPLRGWRLNLRFLSRRKPEK